MPKKNDIASSFKFLTLTPSRWPDAEKLFGPKGACAGCWCMWWKLSKKEFEEGKGDKNKKAFKKRVVSNGIPGIIAYDKNEPVGWCAVEPRSSYKKFETSRVLKPVDDKPVWSIVCFFIKKEYRRKGLSTELIESAVKHAAKKKAKIVEGYPVDMKGKKDYPDTFAYYGTKSAFEKAGFKEVLRRSETRPIMRYYIK
jgi:GNAT superfamily N-acetyltransferase